MSDAGKETLVRSAHFVIQAIVLALLLWMGQTMLTLRDSALEQKYVNINQDARNIQTQKEVTDIKDELKGLRVQIGAIATATSASAANAAIAAQAAQDARFRK